MRTLNTFLLAVPAFLLPAVANAAVCQVDPSGSFAMPHASIDDAIAFGGCDTPGSIIEVYCPAWGCAQGSTTIAGLHDITVVSAELWGYGPVTLANSYSGHAVSIDNSHNIVFDGIYHYIANDHAIDIVDSQVLVHGAPSLGRYSDASATVAVYVEGDSQVELLWVGVSESRIGLEMQTGSSANAPVVNAMGFAATYNDLAVLGDGYPGPRLEVRSDFGQTMHNYIVSNDEGVKARGESIMEFDHTIVAGNMRMWPGSTPYPRVFEVADDAALTIRNALIYDNDAIANPGVQVPWSSYSTPWSCSGGPCFNTPGRILEHASSQVVTIQASTVIDNQNDIVINLDNAGSGHIVLDHTLFAHNWGKVVSASSFFPNCPQIIDVGSALWDNRVDVDPPMCDPGIMVWNAMPVSGATTPDHIAGYPSFMGAFNDLYLVDVNEPFAPYALPNNLYVGPSWGVDGSTVDSDPLAVGYHNPI